MTPQQIKALKLALEALETERDIYREHDEDGAPEYILDAITALEEALKEHAMREVQRLGQEIEQEPVVLHKSGIANSPSDPEICNERSAQACGPVYCGDSGGYCNKCPKQKIIQDMKPCKGMNCGCTDGRSHSLECLAELAAAIAGGVFVKEALAQPEQEPVIDKSAAIRIATVLGWTPPRTWVGLTDEEIDALHMAVKVRLMGTFDTKDIYRVVEQALKGKNT